MKEELDMKKSIHPGFKHLNEGVKPITVCVGSYGDYGQLGINELDINFSEQFDDVHNVNYGEEAEILQKKDFLGGGGTWTISTIDGLYKFSKGLFDCTGLVVSGIDKKTGKNISFMTHQDPKEFLKKNLKGLFIEALQSRLSEIKERCVPGTIDALIIGGRYTDEKNRKNYFDSLDLISNEVEGALGFKPVVYNGPKLNNSHDNMFYNNSKRRLYLMRPQVNETIGGFTNADTNDKNDEEKDKKIKKFEDDLIKGSSFL